MRSERSTPPSLLLAPIRGRPVTTPPQSPFRNGGDEEGRRGWLRPGSRPAGRLGSTLPRGHPSRSASHRLGGPRAPASMAAAAAAARVTTARVGLGTVGRGPMRLPVGSLVGQRGLCSQILPPTPNPKPYRGFVSGLFSGAPVASVGDWELDWDRMAGGSFSRVITKGFVVVVVVVVAVVVEAMVSAIYV
ncbi:hypothetical protein EJB05_41728, partial [Eragrostis curvula]